VGGILGIIIIGIVNLYTMILNVRLKEKMGDIIRSYSDLGFYIFGPLGKSAVDFCIATS
jgi:hypothetical protein